MYLRKRVGTPSDPADPALMEKRADSLFDYAVDGLRLSDAADRAERAVGGIAARRRSPRPPSATAPTSCASSRASRSAADGRRCFVSSEPFTGGDAAAWWRAVGAVSDLVLENYANANLIWRDGAIDGSRRLRARHRQSASKLLAVGIPPSRIGIMIGFQTGAGAGGREGLRPRSRWFSVAKWHTLAVKQVAKELDLAHVWSWGWAQRNERSNDPDKTYAACVWLWAREASLCDAPAILGDELDADTKTGQLGFPAGVRCLYGSTALTASERRGAREGHARPRARPDRAGCTRGRARACAGLAVGRARDGAAGRQGTLSAGARSHTAPRLRKRARASRWRAGSSATSSAPPRSSTGWHSRASRRETCRVSARRSRPCSRGR